MSPAVADCVGWCLFETAIGCCGIAWGESLIVGVQLPERDEDATGACMRRRFPDAPEATPPVVVDLIIARVQATLEGVRDPMLDVPLDVARVPAFHRRVYEVTRAIPPGRTLSYGEVATRIGEPGAARAVGQALGRNPFAPIVPCHRVLAARTGGGGFSADGGVVTKLRLLHIEKAQLGSEPGLFD